MFEVGLYFISHALARTVTRIWTEAYKAYDLSPPHTFLLRLVQAKPGLMPGELAGELRLSRSSVTGFVDSLEEHGLPVRQGDRPDAREVQVYPTDTARALRDELEQTGPRLTERMSAMSGDISVPVLVRELRLLQRKLS
jgi:DNA-binding MarR family transcriptional regulator